MGDNRHPSPRSVLAGVMAFGFEGVGDEGGPVPVPVRRRPFVISRLDCWARHGNIGVALLPMRCVALAPQRSGDQFPIQIEVGSHPPAGRGARRNRWSRLGQPSACVKVRFAASSSAAFKARGNSFPRFSARRRIPRQAFALKKYRCGRSPVSKMSDNEDTTAPLWNSAVLSVKNPVGEPIPEFPQPSEEAAKIPSFIRGQDAGDVLPDHPAWPQSISNCKEDEGQVATRIVHPLSESFDREGLAGGSSDKKLNWLTGPLLEFRHVAV